MSKRELHISPERSLPLDAVTQTFAILAVRGAGKTNTAAVMAEEMFTARLPFVVIDPVGSWYGLRGRADGKGEGLAIPIFGGRHGDVPLERTGGQLLADLVVDQRLTCVLDVSEFSEGDKIRFLIDFAERLYRRNTEPLHLFLEEADDYCPQRFSGDKARLVGAWQNIVRRGRARGLGITMITQRSAVLNKDVLTQIETLFVLRCTSPQDRAAIEAWFQGSGGPIGPVRNKDGSVTATRGSTREIIDGLPQLAAGEAWVWSPSWLQTFERVRVRRRWTFDSGATPKGGSSSKRATLADVDLRAIRERMAATIERAALDDPKALRAELRRREGRIGELQRQLEVKAKPAEKRVEVSVLTASDRAALEQVVKRLEAVADRGSKSADAIRAAAEVLEDKAREPVRAANALRGRILGALFGRPSVEGPGTRLSSTRPQTSEPERPVAAAQERPGPAVVKALRRPTSTSSNGHSAELSKGELDTLGAIAQQADGASRALLTQVLGFKRSYRDLLLQKLRRAGLIEDGTDGRLVATSAGAAALPSDFEPLPTGDRLRERLLREGGELPGGERTVLELVCAEYPKAVGRDAITEVTGFKRSYRDLVIQKLGRRMLVSSSRDGVRASEALFG